MVKIWYSDIAWTNFNSEVIPMNYGNDLTLDTRLLHTYKPPIIIEDNWNGKTFPIQIINNEAYQVNFALKELGVHQVAKIQSCKNIFIYEYETNELIQVDTSITGQMTIEPIGHNRTVDMSFIFTFTDRKKRTIVNPGICRDNTNNLKIVYNSSTHNYYTDFEIINTITDAEKAQFESALDGHLETTLLKHKTGNKMIFYLSEANMILLKKHVENSQPSDVTINTTIIPVEVGICDVSQVGEDLYRCEVSYNLTSILDYA